VPGPSPPGRRRLGVSARDSAHRSESIAVAAAPLTAAPADAHFNLNTCPGLADIGHNDFFTAGVTGHLAQLRRLESESDWARPRPPTSRERHPSRRRFQGIHGRLVSSAKLMASESLASHKRDLPVTVTVRPGLGGPWARRTEKPLSCCRSSRSSSSSRSRRRSRGGGSVGVCCKLEHTLLLSWLKRLE
jgi:hypothetical protein